MKHNRKVLNRTKTICITEFILNSNVGLSLVNRDLGFHCVVIQIYKVKLLFD